MTGQRIHHALAAWADREPDRPAVADLESSWSYRELRTRAEGVAAALTAAGARPGDRVALAAPKNCHTIAAIYGVLAIGAAYVPIPDEAPDAYLRALFTSCAPAMLTTDRASAGRLPEPARHLPKIVVDDLPATSVATASIAVDAEDLAYVLYTSGSTGTPKGVAIPHRAASAFVNWAVTDIPIAPGDRVAGLAPLRFDLSIFDIFATAAAGATLSLVPEGARLHPRLLAGWLGDDRPTVCYFVPSIWDRLLTDGGLTAADCASVRTVLLAGEQVQNRTLRRLFELMPDARFFNLYGPTETNVCTYTELTAAPDPLAAPVPIGRACSGATLAVLNSAGAKVGAVGERGELTVGGPSLAHGYLPTATYGRGVLTDEGRYRTGDLVEIVAAGAEPTLRYLGRLDARIKVRGQFVNLTEVEHVLNDFPDVDAAAAITVGEEAGREIVACCAAEQALDIPAILEHCRTRLFGYELPSRFVFVRTLPMNDNGKVDRRALVDLVEAGVST